MPLRASHPLDFYRGTRHRSVQLAIAAVALERPWDLPGYLRHRARARFGPRGRPRRLESPPRQEAELKKRALVTGGAGFLGSHLCDRLLAEGYSVIAMDNLLTGTTDNIAHLAGNRDFRFVFHDVTDYIFVEGPVDAVLHFASPASPRDYHEMPIQTLKVGSLGTHKALGLAKAKGARFLLASTSEVYGDPLIHPQPETYWGNVNPVGPRGVYDEAKRFAEAMTMAYHRFHGVDTKIVRIFNTFGPRMRLEDGRAIPNFLLQALRGQPLTVYGDGMQTRSFCYVDDLVDGIVRLLHSDLHDPVNIGNPEEWTVLRMAEVIRDLMGAKTPIVYEPLPVDDPKVRQPDITIARRELGWEPKTEIYDRPYGDVRGLQTARRSRSRCPARVTPPRRRPCRRPSREPWLLPRVVLFAPSA